MNRYNFLKECAFLILFNQTQNKSPKGDYSYVNINDDFKSIRGHSMHLYKDTRAVKKNFDYDAQFDVHQTFEESLNFWIDSKIMHTDLFQWNCVNQTQRSLIEWVSRNHAKKIFIPNQSYWQKNYLNYYHDDVNYFDSADDLPRNSVLIFDLPTRGIMDVRKDMNKILQTCTEKNIAVYLDCTFMLLSRNNQIELNHHCIKCVNISFTKIWPIIPWGCTITGYKEDWRPPKNYFNVQPNLMKKLQSWMNLYPLSNYLNWLTSQQEKWCRFLKLEQSDCVIHAKGTKDTQEYWQDKFWIEDGRFQEKEICLTPLIENYDLICQFYNLNSLPYSVDML